MEPLVTLAVLAIFPTPMQPYPCNFNPLCSCTHHNTKVYLNATLTLFVHVLYTPQHKSTSRSLCDFKFNPLCSCKHHTTKVDLCATLTLSVLYAPQHKGRSLCNFNPLCSCTVYTPQHKGRSICNFNPLVHIRTQR
jgi:hypothetical protein